MNSCSLQPTHRQYEALRTFFVDRGPVSRGGRAVRLHTGSFRVLCHEFRNSPQREFSLPHPVAAAQGILRQKIITLRKCRCTYIHALDRSGEKLSPASIRRFSRNSVGDGDRRTARNDSTQSTDVGRRRKARPTHVPNVVGGLFLFVPNLPIPLEKCWPMLSSQAKMMPAAHAIRLLAMKWFGSARQPCHELRSSIGAFAGLMIPKREYPAHPTGLLPTDRCGLGTPCNETRP